MYNRSSRRRQNRRRGRRNRRRNSIVALSTLSSIRPNRPAFLNLRGRKIVNQNDANVGFDIDFSAPLNYLTSPSRARLATFADYRIVSIRATVSPLVDDPGLTFIHFSEVPIAAIPVALPDTHALPMSSSYKGNASRTIMWRSASFNDLSFYPTSAALPAVPVYFYLFSTNSGTLTNYMSIILQVTVQVRGIAA